MNYPHIIFFNETLNNCLKSLLNCVFFFYFENSPLTLKPFLNGPFYTFKFFFQLVN